MPEPRPEKDPRPKRRRANDEIIEKIDDTLAHHGVEIPPRKDDQS